MALQHANNLVSEKFFLAVSNGSVASLKEIVAENEPDVVAEIVQSKNSQGETPLLVAIREQHFEMVKYLVDDLKADIGQMGLVWNGLTNMTVPPLFAAINYYYPKLAKQDFQIAIYLMDQDTVNESSVLFEFRQIQQHPTTRQDGHPEVHWSYSCIDTERRRRFKISIWQDMLAGSHGPTY